MRTLLLPSALLATLLLLAGCGGGGGSGSDPAPPAADTTPPTVTISADTAGAAAGELAFRIVFSEDVGDSFTVDDLQLSAGTVRDLLRASGTQATVIVVPPPGTAGTLELSLAAGSVADAAGNVNAQRVAATQPFDTRAAGPGVPAGYVLAWADEFDVDGLPDPTRWAYDTFRNPVGWFNNELQYYARDRAENAVVRDGRLVITARRESLSSLPDWGGQRYSSARLITKNRAAWTHGFVEVRAKMPCGRGTWPAIWMLGLDDERWPLSGEIDIVEHVGSNPTRILGTGHTQNNHAGNAIGAETQLPTACSAFHDYQLTWTPGEIRIAVDSREYFRTTDPGGGRAGWPFESPFYLLLNIAIGGDLGGPVDDAIFPVTLEVEHVRVYQRAGG
jgi:beta-glucanase (GH16 family)